MTVVSTVADLNAATSTDVMYDPGTMLSGGARAFSPKKGVHYHSTTPGKKTILTADVAIEMSALQQAIIEDLTVAKSNDAALGSDSSHPSHDVELVRCDLSGFAPVSLNAMDYNIMLTDVDVHDAQNNGIITGRYAGDNHVRPPSGGYGFHMRGGSVRRTGIKPAANVGAVHAIYNDWHDSMVEGTVIEDFANSGITWRFGNGMIQYVTFIPNHRGTADVSYFETDPITGHTVIQYCKSLSHINNENKDVYLDQGTTPLENILVQHCNGMIVNINADNRGLATWDGDLGYVAAGAEYWPGAIVTPPPPPPAIDVVKAKAEIRLTLDWMRSSRKTGGLGYSLSQVDATHAYKGYLALGAVYP